jgi:transposase
MADSKNGLNHQDENHSSFDHIIAIDVGKAELEVFILPGDGRLTIANKPKAILALLKREQRRNQAQGLGEMLLVCEPTGGYERRLLKIAWQLGITALRACGRRVRCFANAMGRLAKTDKIDAELLARYAQKTDKLVFYQQPSPAQECLSQLVARRSVLMAMLQAEKNRCEHASITRVKTSLRRTKKLLEAERKAIEAEIRGVIRQDPELAHKARLLDSFKGVGFVNIATLLAFMPELGSLSKTEIAALAGLAPYNNDSASSNKPRHIFAGRGEVRRCLYMAALAASRSNKILKPIYQRLIAKGKIFKVAITALMRKIITILNAMIKEDQPWKGAEIA